MEIAIRILILSDISGASDIFLRYSRCMSESERSSEILAVFDRKSPTLERGLKKQMP
jgi:hypothetical protein